MLSQGYFEDTIKSSPTEFAFHPPQDYKVPPSKAVNSVPYPITIPPQGQYIAPGPYTNMSGTITPNDINIDSSNSLPRISRNFAPPSANDTRRPATTAGPVNRSQNTNGGYQNPFTSSPSEIVPSQSASVDPHYQSETPPSWQSPASAHPVNYPATAVGVPQSYPYNGLMNPASRTASVHRPQTSDGLPSYTNMALPGTRALLHGGGYSAPTYSVGSQMMSGYPTSRYGSYDQNAGRYPFNMSGSSTDSDLQFVSLAGPVAPKKRSRRRYDEIERIYSCEWKGCDKAYGTLNHLNAHVAMQKHGEKRLPIQFKEMRKEWRKKKREETNEAASKEFAAVAAQQAAVQQAAAAAVLDPSQPQYQWADQTRTHATTDPNSLYPNGYSAPSSNSLTVDTADPYGHRGSTSSFLTSAPTWSSSDTRPTTANTVSSDGSPTDGRFGYNNSWNSNGVYDRKVMTPQSATQSSAAFTPYGMSHHNMV